MTADQSATSAMPVSHLLYRNRFLIIDCHQAIHMERTALLGDEERAENHYMKVNNCTYAEMKKDRSEANKIHQRRNNIEWQTDTSFLKKYMEK